MFAKRVLLVSMGLICLSHFPRTAAAQTFITAWGSFGSGNGQFDNPNCVATDARQRLCLGRLQQPHPEVHKHRYLHHSVGHVRQW
jgi:hypothetical protein